MIFPEPKKLELTNGSYTIKNALKTACIMCFAKSVDVSDEIKKTQNAMLSKEEYVLDISENGIEIVYSTAEGKFRAVTSLFQLVKANGSTIPCVKVEDNPDFERRGYMLDISRGRKPKVETLKNVIDYLAFLKYNEFQIYIEDFSFKYKAYPQVNADFDCLTPEDIEELDAYCKERFIDLVPNQNCFGHMANWLDRDEFKHLGLGVSVGENSGTLNPLLPETFDFVDGLFDSMLPHFTSEYVNIGMDEAFGLGKYEIEEYCKEKGKDNVFMDYLNRMSEVINEKHGKKVMFWADMITNYPNAHTRIPKNATALEWGYELIQSQTMAEHCWAFQQKNVDFYVCPSCNTHLSYTGRSDVTTFNLRTAGEVGRKYGARGYLLTDWGMHGDGHAQFGVWSYFPIALAAQYAWNVGREQNGEDFKAEYIRAANKLIDGYWFDGKNVSEYLYRISNYYLLEPERIHVGTICGEIFAEPLCETAHYVYFDLKNCIDNFYFDNVINYINSILKDVEKIDFDAELKRQVILNSKMVIVSAELCKVRIDKTVTEDKRKEICELIDWVTGEYKELWLNVNFEKGVESYLSKLADRKQELLAL